MPCPASLSPFIRDSSRVPVAFYHMLWTKPNNQGKLYLQSSFSLDQCPDTGNQKRPYHTLKPLPFFPLCHHGYDRKYYQCSNKTKETRNPFGWKFNK